MDPRHLELAAQFCDLIGFDDLVDFLGLEPDVSAADAQAALKKKRTFYQSMQSNPKHADKAKFFIKHYRALDQVMSEPAAHLAHQQRSRNADKLPMLEMAIDSVLADGVFTPQEEAFIRESAENIGIDPDTVDQILEERMAKTGARRAATADMSLPPVPPPPPAFGKATLGSLPADPPTDAEPQRKRRKASDGWWTPAFTDLLLSVIPEGTHRMVDIACASAWSAVALLPERPGMEYLGMDRDADRIQLAQRTMTASPLASRVALLPGLPYELPLNDASVDVVISVMALRYFFDTEPIFTEAHRVLKEGGRFIVVEPDGLSQQFYFDGHLHVLNRAYQNFMRAADIAMAETRTGAFIGRPGLAIGPELGARLRQAGFRPHKMAVHPIQGFRMEVVSDFGERVNRNIDAVAQRAGLKPIDKPVREVRRALADVVDMMDAEDEGYGGHLQPAFLAVGLKA